MMPAIRVLDRVVVRGPVYHHWWDRFIFSRRQHLHPCELGCRTDSGAPVLVICTTPSGDSTCALIEIGAIVACANHEIST